MSAEDSQPEKTSYIQALKATAQIGGSSIVNIVFGIIRTKVVAILLGPSGVGLMSLYNMIIDLTQSFACLGVPNSGVRQIAEAAGTGDARKIASTTIILRRMSFVLGLLGAFLLVVLSLPISEFTFSDDQQALGVALLAIAVFFRIVSAGQATLIQGMRRISDLALMNVISAFLATIVSIAIIIYFGEAGIVFALIGMALVSCLVSWYFSRKVLLTECSLPLRDMQSEAVKLLRLGLAFMASGLLTLGAAYVIRIIIVRTSGVDAAGLYQAAWVLGGLYTGVVLQAMGTDFYPRLTAVADDNGQCNRLVNDQAQVSVLLAGPGVIATLTFAPLIMRLFYSAEFYPAVDLLRWICLGMMLRIVAWPMGFVVLAKNAQKIFLWTEVAATAVHIGGAWLFIGYFGVDGAGIAFFALYGWHSVLIYFVTRRLSGFRWSRLNLKIGSCYLAIVAIVFGGFVILPTIIATTLGALAMICTGLFSLRAFLTLCPPKLIPAVIRPWIPRSV
ncbi:O-antigen translocase [Microvirga rosea]|uniref:O-antigen translocase n=1 Tax=Microvirga rosea TaxID=2715425 RepID=UPI001D0A4B4D|nr:O-antigen translocase [Microvirga rosea]MCB8818934.1 O-antigen translocase [Microvirga rosea]